MPLAKWITKKVISKNIAELIRSWKEKDQAAAIAYDTAKKSRKTKKK